MPEFILEELQELKRKDLIALCKEHDIKCVGKNSELIEKLMELAKNPNFVSCTGTVQDNEEATVEDNFTTSPNFETTGEVAGECAGNIQDKVENIEINMTNTDDNRPDVENAEILEGAVETETESSRITNDNMKSEEQTVEKMQDENIVPSTPKQERRMSERLFASNLKKMLEPSPVKKPSNLNQTINRKSTGLFNRNISHIPTLKERVSSLASKPSAIKRPLAQNSTTAAATVKRPKYDLKESLKKPLPYKPYTGPVRKL